MELIRLLVQSAEAGKRCGLSSRQRAFPIVTICTRRGNEVQQKQYQAP
jgi:hypothetical protein